MPANFLIVCGGAGRGILQQFDALGFDGALQIDVQQGLVQTSDRRILQVGLPVGYGAHTFDGPAIMADYLQAAPSASLMTVPTGWYHHSALLVCGWQCTVTVSATPTGLRLMCAKKPA